MQNHPERTTPCRNLSQKTAQQPHSFFPTQWLLTISSVFLFLCPQLIFLASAGFKEAGAPEKRRGYPPHQLFNKTFCSRWAAHQLQPLVLLSRPPFPAAGTPAAELPARRSLPPLQRSPAGARLPRKARPSLRASSRESAPAVSSLSLPPPCPPRQRSRLSRTDFPLPPLHSYLQRVSKTIFISLEGRREKIINPFLAFTFSTAISGCVFSARRIISLLSKIRGPAATRSRPAPSLAARRPQRSTVLPAALKAVLNKGPSATRNHACPPGITARWSVPQARPAKRGERVSRSDHVGTVFPTLFFTRGVIIPQHSHLGDKAQREACAPWRAPRHHHSPGDRGPTEPVTRAQRRYRPLPRAAYLRPARNQARCSQATNFPIG